MEKTRRVLFFAALIAAIFAAWFPRLDTIAVERLDEGTKRAVLTYAAARTLNAVISVAQESTVSIQPLGVGITFAPGQLLRPLNHLIEQFSSVMLFASISFGIQRVLVTIGSHQVVTIVMTLSAIGCALMLLRGKTHPDWATRVLLGLLLLRFAVPLVVVGSDAGFRWFLAGDYVSGQRAVETSTREIPSLASLAIPAKPDEGPVDRIKRWTDSAVSLPDRIQKQAEALAASVESAVTQVIKVTVVFLLQTVLLPLVLLWVVVRVAGLVLPMAIGRPLASR